MARKIAAAKKEAAKAKAGKNFFPPTPFLFARPSGKVFVPAARSAAIKFRSPDFRQKKFRFRPTNTTTPARGRGNLKFKAQNPK
ncbi:hypothetical protein HZB94_00665 [Candidatus Falkowbacteria bacterium]|nr:hypothetical protein [Candidatus Falkowbacteria bacterium]